MRSRSVARSNGITKLEKSKRLLENLSPKMFSFNFKRSNSNSWKKPIIIIPFYVAASYILYICVLISMYEVHSRKLNVRTQGPLQSGPPQQRVDFSLEDSKVRNRYGQYREVSLKMVKPWGFVNRLKSWKLHTKWIAPCESTAEEVSFEW